MSIVRVYDRCPGRARPLVCLCGQSRLGYHRSRCSACATSSSPLALKHTRLHARVVRSCMSLVSDERRPISRSAHHRVRSLGESVKNCHRLVSLTLFATLAVAPLARAQETPPETPDQSVPPSSPVGPVRLRVGAGELAGGWMPIGALPVDQAGSGARG